MTDFFYDPWFVILEFLIPGIFLGGIYDIFRLIRISRNDRTYDVRKAIQSRFFSNTDSKKQKAKKKASEFILVFAEDILFFVIVAITEILAIFYFNGGEIRIYCLLVSAVGFFAYQKTLGKLVIFFSRKILFLTRKIIYFIACVILTPIFFISHRFVKLVHVINRKNKKDEK